MIGITARTKSCFSAQTVGRSFRFAGNGTGTLLRHCWQRPAYWGIPIRSRSCMRSLGERSQRIGAYRGKPENMKEENQGAREVIL
ncbi:hypothetical protein BC936DRAFT_138842 [Jimgerdemannia flammicorona]|uniref:Uncharacterized protein n=1 Tax=Jimgerdemannia flammicorona TaxID=994334 RepID=A0A433DI91_9FUNG|nr:hypothetical protein BC936DRAFT_138842 [Jimgerdemannia flammicorona]